MASTLVSSRVLQVRTGRDSRPHAHDALLGHTRIHRTLGAARPVTLEGFATSQVWWLFLDCVQQALTPLPEQTPPHAPYVAMAPTTRNPDSPLPASAWRVTELASPQPKNATDASP